MRQLTRAIRSFAVEDEGAQVVEYALITAVVSIALVIAITGIAGGNLTTFIDRVSTCLTGTCV